MGHPFLLPNISFAFTHLPYHSSLHQHDLMFRQILKVKQTLTMQFPYIQIYTL